MPRKQRIEYPGAVYHIISRGNYRKDLFTHEKTAEAFEKTIFEAAERCGWRLYAYGGRTQGLYQVELPEILQTQGAASA